MYARKCNVVQDDIVSIETSIQIVLNQKFDKQERVGCSKWSKKDLSIEQTGYAALDVTKPLEAYFEKATLPGLNTWLKVEGVQLGTIHHDRPEY